MQQLHSSAELAASLAEHLTILEMLALLCTGLSQASQDQFKLLNSCALSGYNRSHSRYRQQRQNFYLSDRLCRGAGLGKVWR